MFLKRIKQLWSKKPFIPGDKIRCPCCGAVFTLVKVVKSVKLGLVATDACEIGPSSTSQGEREE